MTIHFEIHHSDGLAVLKHLPPESVDLAVVDPPYGLGKDYGNNSDCLGETEYLQWTQSWVDATLRALKPSGLLYVFQSWQRAPEVFSLIKLRARMINEIIWDRRVPSMGGTTRKFSSVHDNIGVFAKSQKYFFDLDPVRVPYDEITRKARSRSIFEGSKWLELGCNPKDVWSISRLHAIHRERQNHPTQKPRELIDRIILSSSPIGGLVVDPFAGTGTTLESCLEHGRRCIAAEINHSYVEMIHSRAKAAAANRVDGLASPARAGVLDSRLTQTESNEPLRRQLSLLNDKESATVERVGMVEILRLLKTTPMSSSEVAQALGVSRVAVAKQMFNLMASGRVEAIGRGRGTKYRERFTSYIPDDDASR